jgi:hypothetical protein
MVHSEILEKQNKMLEVYGTARAKGIITVTINTFRVGLPWLNQKCYNFYVRQLKGAPEEITTTSKSDGETTSNVLG